MTIGEMEDLKANELKKLAALEQIVRILDQLDREVDGDAVEWVIEKLTE